MCGCPDSWLSVLLLDVSIPEKPKLRFVERVPLVPKVRREPKNLSDIRGPSTEATEFTEGNFAILVSDVRVLLLREGGRRVAKCPARELIPSLHGLHRLLFKLVCTSQSASES